MKIVVFEDKDLEVLKDYIRCEYFNNEPNSIMLDIYNKLVSKDKTLKDLGWECEYQKEYKIWFYSKNVKKFKNENISDFTEIFNMKDKTIAGRTIEENIAIINTAIELFCNKDDCGGNENVR